MFFLHLLRQYKIISLIRVVNYDLRPSNMEPILYLGINLNQDVFLSSEWNSVSHVLLRIHIDLFITEMGP